MGLEINSDLTVLTIAGLLGTVDYWLFNQFNFFNFFDKNQTDEKAGLIIMLGLENLFSYNIITYLNVNCNWGMPPIIIFLKSIVLSKIISFITLWGINFVLKWFINNFYENKKSYRYYEKGINKILNSHQGYTYAYIYDFDNNLIGHGYVSYYSDDSTGKEEYLSLTLPDNYEHNNLIEQGGDELFVDIKNKIKVYLIFIDNNER